MKKTLLLGIAMFLLSCTAFSQSLLDQSALSELAQLLIDDDVEKTDKFFIANKFLKTPTIAHANGMSYSLICQIGDENGMTVNVNYLPEVGYYHYTFVFGHKTDFTYLASLLKSRLKHLDTIPSGPETTSFFDRGFTFTERSNYSIIAKKFPVRLLVN